MNTITVKSYEFYPDSFEIFVNSKDAGEYTTKIDAYLLSILIGVSDDPENLIDKTFDCPAMK